MKEKFRWYSSATAAARFGIRLEKQPLTLPSLVLDHFEQTPTAN